MESNEVGRLSLNMGVDGNPESVVDEARAVLEQADEVKELLKAQQQRLPQIFGTNAYREARWATACCASRAGAKERQLGQVPGNQLSNHKSQFRRDWFLDGLG